jgi:hypothetical protein
MYFGFWFVVILLVYYDLAFLAFAGSLVLGFFVSLILFIFGPVFKETIYLHASF